MKKQNLLRNPEYNENSTERELERGLSQCPPHPFSVIRGNHNSPLNDAPHASDYYSHITYDRLAG